MATHAAIRSSIEGFWAGQRTRLEAAQTDYAAAHRGRFWQGLGTPSPPDNGAKASPDFSSRPSDQPERWSDIFHGPLTLPPAAWPAQMRVDVYDGPRGTGWSATATYTKGGETWARTFHFGPETEREQDWVNVTPVVFAAQARSSFTGGFQMGKLFSFLLRFGPLAAAFALGLSPLLEQFFPGAAAVINSALVFLGLVGVKPDGEVVSGIGAAIAGFVALVGVARKLYSLISKYFAA